MKSYMQALTLTDNGPQLLANTPIPTPGSNEALIKVRTAGICSTDLQLVAGYKGGYRGILGHEFVGEVTTAPDDPAWIGQRVVGELNIGCGNCDLCGQGLHKHCHQRQSLGIIRRDGAFAEYLTLPVTNLHAVPDVLSDAEAVFCEPLAAALQILEQVQIRPDSKVYVLGDGRLGLLVAQVLAQTQCDLTAFGRHSDKLSILNEQGISQTAVVRPDMKSESYPAADIVVEVTGSPSGFAMARGLVRPGGTLILKSTFASPLTAFDISSLVVDEIRVIGSRCGPFAPALRMLARGDIAVEPLIHGRYTLDDGVAALEYAGSPGVLKMLLSM